MYGVNLILMHVGQ